MSSYSHGEPRHQTVRPLHFSKKTATALGSRNGNSSKHLITHSKDTPAATSVRRHDPHSTWGRTSMPGFPFADAPLLTLPSFSCLAHRNTTLVLIWSCWRHQVLWSHHLRWVKSFQVLPTWHHLCSVSKPNKFTGSPQWTWVCHWGV